MRTSKQLLLLATCLALPMLSACTAGDSSVSDPGDVADEVETSDAGENAGENDVETDGPAAELPVDQSTWEAGGTIPSGMEDVKAIEILEVRGNGTGPVCGTGKKATLAYKAMRADGSVLDPGTRPYSFVVGPGNAIKGWHVVVAKMRVGDDFTIMLPQELAYGPSRGDLKFNMKLLSFE